MQQSDELLPDFSADSCATLKLHQINPQQRAMWVLLAFELTPAQLAEQGLTPHKPMGLYLFGKAASKVWLNHQYLGNNGQPGVDGSEVPGLMDKVFYIPDGTLIEGQNRLVMQLSGHHSVVTLDYPMHLIALYPFAETGRYVQQFAAHGMILIGAFAVGSIYFLVLSFGRNREAGVARYHFPIFAALCLLAMLQLSAELARGIYNYTYPWHDVRLMAITSFSYFFGVLLLVYNSLKVAKRNALHWIYIGSLITLLTVLFSPGYDTKTTFGILLPILINLLQILWYMYKRQNPKLKNWFIGHLLIAVVIFVSSSNFHEFLHFLIVSLVLLGIFIQQAREYQTQQAELMTERSRSAKLEYRLAQQSQQQAPTRLEITNAGHTEFVNACDIAYTKAAGDYVEIHLIGGSEKLYSGTLKQLESILPDTFLRVHRSYMVNLDCVTGLFSEKSEQKSRTFLNLGADSNVPVSRRLLPTVRDSLKSNH